MTDQWHEFEARPGLTARVRLTPNRKGRPIVTGLDIQGDAITALDLRNLSMRQLEQAGAPQVPEPSTPLGRPDGSDPDGHRKLVAEHYRFHAARSPRPAKLMAEASGVPVPTIHTWIREARLRGHLPEARRGKAG